MSTEPKTTIQESTFTQPEATEHVHGPHCNHGHHHHHAPLKPIERAAPKIGRNDPCLCGSQKKYKKCCGQ